MPAGQNQYWEYLAEVFEAVRRAGPHDRPSRAELLDLARTWMMAGSIAASRSGSQPEVRPRLLGTPAAAVNGNKCVRVMPWDWWMGINPASHPVRDGANVGGLAGEGSVNFEGDRHEFGGVAVDLGHDGDYNLYTIVRTQLFGQDDRKIFPMIALSRRAGKLRFADAARRPIRKHNGR
jgi:hypothetical protein